MAKTHHEYRLDHALPLTWVATIPLSTFGGGVIAGAYFLTSGYLLTNQPIQRQTNSIVEPARA